MTRKRLLKTQDEKKKKTQDGCDTETVVNENYNSLMLWDLGKELRLIQ